MTGDAALPHERTAPAARSAAHARPRATPSNAGRIALANFQSKQGGSIAVISAVVMAVLVMCAGAGIDLSRAHVARTQAIRALEIALLGGARTLQLANGNDELGRAAAERYFNANLSQAGDLVSDVRFGVRREDNTITASGRVLLKTYLLALVGLPTLTVLGTEEVSAFDGTADAGDGATRLEIAIALDVSEHMRVGLPAAAKATAEMIDIIATADPRQRRHRYALVPFAESVSLPSAVADLVRGPLRSGECSTPGCRQLRRLPESCRSPGCRPPQRTAGRCTSERTGVDAATDAPPQVAPLLPLYPNRFGSCLPATEVQPLAAEPAALAKALASQTPGGASAGHLGLAWAWYALSPGWSRIWQDATAAGYDGLDRTLPSGAPALRKIVVLVTPGRFDRQYCDGVADDADDGCDAPNGTAHAQARTMCRNMIARGIEIFAVGYPSLADADAVSTLRDHCVTTRDAYYTARDGEELRQALRDIALRITTSRLTQ